MNRPILFSTAAYAYLRDELLNKQHFLAGEIQSKAFPDGEFYHRILTDVDKQDCILIGGTIDDNNTLELYDLAQGLVHQGASSLSIVIPYFGYSTMERAVKPGEIVKAKNRTKICVQAILDAIQGKSSNEDWKFWNDVMSEIDGL